MKESHGYAVEYKVAMVQQHIYGIYYHLQPIMTMIETSGKPRSSAALPLGRPLPTLVIRRTLPLVRSVVVVNYDRSYDIESNITESFWKAGIRICNRLNYYSTTRSDTAGLSVR
jgi:hypothetical protein